MEEEPFWDQNLSLTKDFLIKSEVEIFLILLAIYKLKDIELSELTIQEQLMLLDL